MIEFLQPALIIFCLRVVDVALLTLRVLMVARGLKALAWVFAFSRALIFVFALRLVLSDLGDWSKILAYATGFATGMVVGMLVEERLALGYTHLRIISSRRGAEITEHLRDKGYAVTEVSALGRDGAVALLNCDVRRRQVGKVEQIIVDADPQAFITAEEVRPVQRGYWRK
jgi:uncharacterized protein YebE (UPF0316 family)